MQPTDEPAAPVVARACVEFADESERYRQDGRDFTRQFCHIYGCRLETLRQRLQQAADRLWDGVAVVGISQLEEEEHADCVLFGVLFKQQQLKPSILKEISDEHNLMPQPPRDRFNDESDYLLLEDQLARIRLEGDIDPLQYVTGVVCAVLGREVCGKFQVKGICFPDLVPQQVDRPLPPEDVWLLLVSGLGVEAGGDLFLAQMLVDLVTGQLGSEQDQREMAAVARVIVAGNSLSASSQDRDFLKRAAYLTSDVAEQSAEAVRTLDDLLQQLAASCDLDLMPGEFDPTNHLLPQRPLHPCLLPKATAYRSFHGATNPYQALVAGRRVAGTSGQNVHDLYRYSVSDDPLTSLERLLTWGHLCPTAPDTLDCFPYYDRDPFIIEDCPDLLFAGNQSHFATKLYEGPRGQRVRLLCLPEFHRSATCALVNLRSLEVQKLSLGSAVSRSEESSPQPEK